MAQNDILAKVSVIINAQTAALGKDLKGATSKIDSFTGEVKKLGAVIGGAFAIQQVADFTLEVVKLSGEAKGVKAAFDRLPDSIKVLEDLKKATGGTVSELDLMKRTVQAANFGISLNALPKLLEFATLRAQQTGQSVDYLVDSIVTGIGRKSPLILDNLGISAVALKEKLGDVSTAAASVGQVADAVGAIAGESLQNMAGFSQNASTSLQQLTAEWVNFKVALGDAANGTGVIGTSIKILTDLITNLTDVLKGVSDGPASLKEALGLSSGSESVKKELNATVVAFKALNDFALKYYNGDVKKAQESFLNNQYKEILNLQIQKANLDELREISGDQYKESYDNINLQIKVRKDIIAAIKEQTTAVKTLQDVEQQVRKAPKPVVFPVEFNLNYDNLDYLLKEKELPTITIDIEIPEESTAAADLMVDNLKRIKDEAENLRVELNNIIESSIEQGIYGIADAFGQLATSADGVTAFKNALLSTFGDLLQNLGKIAIQTGIGVEAIKKALTSLNGGIAIAAGAALVALGAAVKSRVRNLGSSSGGGSSSISSSATRSSSYISKTAQNSTSPIPSFQIKGQDLWVVFNNFAKANKYTTAGG